MNTLECYIFDLDGTLYSFGGNNFSDSRLGVAVRGKYENLLSVFSNQTPRETYKKMCAIEKQTGVGVSAQFAQMFNITRCEVFEMTWGEIDPTMIIQNSYFSQHVIPELSRKEKKLYLVTAAPKIWANIVLEYLGLKDFFTTIYGGEDIIDSKREIFEQILRETLIEAHNTISIGDQLETDIIPARVLGLQTLLIEKQDDLLKLL